MSADDPSDDEGSTTTDEGTDGSFSGTDSDGDSGGNVRERLGQEADRAVEQFDEGLVDLLSWVLETETRARIYVFLRQNPQSTSDEIADGTGLYPSTVREALAELHEEGKVERAKRENDGAGNNPYEYSAMAPSELVGSVVDDVQSELNTVFNLDRYLDRGDADDLEAPEEEPVTITVEDGEGDADDDVDTEGVDTVDATTDESDAEGADGDGTDENAEG